MIYNVHSISTLRTSFFVETSKRVCFFAVETAVASLDVFEAPALMNSLMGIVSCIFPFMWLVSAASPQILNSTQTLFMKYI